MNETNQASNQASKNESIPEESISWLDQEEEALGVPSGQFQKLPSVKFENGKITNLDIDISKPFGIYVDKERNKIKAIIPCRWIVNGKIEQANWWLNKKNPVYRDLLHLAKIQSGNSMVVKVIQIGTGEKTTYQLVKE